VHLVCFTVEIYHDARSHERHTAEDVIMETGDYNEITNSIKLSSQSLVTAQLHNKYAASLLYKKFHECSYR